MLLSRSVVRAGGQVIVFDPDPNCPAAKDSREVISADWNDQEALAAFFAKADVVTYEFENVSSQALTKFEKQKPIFPSLTVLRTTQDRLAEKTFLKNAHLPYVNFAAVNHIDGLPKAAANLTFPLICKSTTGGYDGKFQYFVDSKESLESLVNSLRQKYKNDFAMTLEEAINLHMELSCITARSPKGEEITFPIFENVHTNHILDTTIVPARISKELEQKISSIALEAARKLEVVGLLCTEFFIAKKGNPNSSGIECGDFVIYINEFAPRPHNSGHVTISAFDMSQFDVLAHILLGLPLVSPHLLKPGYFCMANLLGDIWLKQNNNSEPNLDLSARKNYPQIVDIVIYGKKEARIGRKMGHFVTYAQDAKEAIDSALSFRESLSTRKQRGSPDSLKQARLQD